MKTLVNKANPQIRITAPDGMVKNRTNCWAIWSEGNRLMLLDKDNWTLVEEEPVEWSEEDEAMRDTILRLLSCFVGTLECDSNPSLSTSYLVYGREIAWLKSLKPQPKQDRIKEQTKK